MPSDIFPIEVNYINQYPFNSVKSWEFSYCRPAKKYALLAARQIKVSDSIMLLSYAEQEKNSLRW